MKSESDFLQNIRLIKASREDRKHILRSNIYQEFNDLMNNKKSSIKDLSLYYDYLYDKLNRVDFDVEVQIQQDIDRELGYYVSSLAKSLKNQGILELKDEFLKLQLKKSLNKDDETRQPKRKSVEEIAYTLSNINHIELDSLK